MPRIKKKMRIRRRNAQTGRKLKPIKRRLKTSLGKRKRRILKRGTPRPNRKSRRPAKRRSVRFNAGAPAPNIPKVPVLQLPAVSHYSPQAEAVQSLQPGRKLNILYLVHQFYPEAYTGTEKFILNMAKAMIGRGHRVKVAAYSGNSPETFQESQGEVVFREYEYEGVPVLAYRHKQMDPAKSFEAGNPDLAAFAESVIARESPDVIHIGHPMRAMEFMQASLRLGVPYVITLTDYWFICPKGIMLHSSRDLCAGPENGEACLVHCQIPGVAQRLAAHIPLLQSARKILSPSAFLASMMKHSLPDLQVEVLNHGIECQPEQANAKTYRRGDTLTLFYGGSLNEHKGVHVILEAMSRIPSKRLRLNIYGSGSEEYTARLQEAAARDKRVKLCGTYTSQEMAQLFQSADVAVVPSLWYENYPLAMHEALAHRIPVLASAAGGMAETIKDGVNGYTFRLGDAAHLAERIRILLAKPGLLNDLKAKMAAQPIPSVDQEAAAYESVYVSCLT